MQLILPDIGEDVIGAVLVDLHIPDGGLTHDSRLSELVLVERLLVDVNKHVHGTEVLDLLLQVGLTLRTLTVILRAERGDASVAGHDHDVNLGEGAARLRTVQI